MPWHPLPKLTDKIRRTGHRQSHSPKNRLKPLVLLVVMLAGQPTRNRDLSVSDGCIP